MKSTYLPALFPALIVGFSLGGLVVSGLSCKKAEEPATVNTDSHGNPAVGAIDEGKFYVRFFENGKYKAHYTHQATSIAKTTCEIAKSAAQSDIDCMMHVHEGDLAFYGLTFQINIPAGMCNYLAEYPYFYYNWPSARSDGTLNIIVTDGVIETPATDCTTPTDGYFAEMDADTGNCVLQNPDHVPLWAALPDGSAKSYYDWTDFDGPNCDDGSYIVTGKSQTTNADGSSASSSTISSKGKFGGTIGACLGGPPIDNPAQNWPKTKKGYPTELITDVSVQGFNKLYEMKAIIGTRSGHTTVPIANHYNYQSEFLHGAVAYASLPKPISPGLGLPAAHAPYEYLCLDSAFEVKHRIRAWVVDWNSATELAKHGAATALDVGDPDQIGAEPNWPPAPNDPTQGDFNDLVDWDDYAPNGFPKEY